MPDIEKVIKGVRCCSEIESEKRCDECPYDATDEDRKKFGWTCHWEQLKADVLEILETTVPHILAVEDLRDEATELVYLETKDSVSSRIEAAIVSHDDRDSSYCTFYVGLELDDEKWSEYGETWRCWDKFPDVKRMWQRDPVKSIELSDEEMDNESMHRVVLHMNSIAESFNRRKENP